MGAKYPGYLHDLHHTTPCTPMLKFTIGGGGGRPMADALPMERTTADRESSTHLTSKAIAV